MSAATRHMYITPPVSEHEEPVDADEDMKLHRDGKTEDFRSRSRPSDLTTQQSPAHAHHSHTPASAPHHDDYHVEEAGEAWSAGRSAGQAVAFAADRQGQYYYGGGQQHEYNTHGWSWPQWQQQFAAYAPLPATFPNASYGHGFAGNWYAPHHSQRSCVYSYYPAHSAGSQLSANAQLFVPSPPLQTESNTRPLHKLPSSARSAPTQNPNNKERAAAKARAQESQIAITDLAVPWRQSSLPQSLQLGRAHKTFNAKQSTSYRDPQNPRLHMLERPQPTPLYSRLASQEPQVLSAPRPLLVVLDLNGTLLKRSPNSRTSFTPRPHLDEFLGYVLANHKLMIWSSARPENVAIMCSRLFKPEQHKQLAAVWARDKLRLTNKAYNEKVQVYKQLSWIWNDTKIQATNPDKQQMWSQSNTVLIDDSVDKAASEPHNLVELAEFHALPEQIESDTYLKEIAHYLGTLSCQVDVSAYIKTHPFKLSSKAPLGV